MTLTPQEREAQRNGFDVPQDNDLLSKGDDAIRRNAVNTLALLDRPNGPEIVSDLVESSDPRLPQWTDDEWSIAFTDSDGHIAAGFDARGRLHIHKPLELQPSTISTAALGTGTGAVDFSTGWAQAYVDSDGNVAWGLRNDGRTFTARQERSAPSRTALVCIGDSLVRGYTNGDAWDLSEAFPALMEPLLPEVEIVNYGFGGMTVDQVAALLPAMTLNLTVAGGMIPESGSVSVTVKQKLSIGPAGTFTIFGGINGVFGNLNYDGAGNWEFDRQAAGDAIPAEGVISYTVGRDRYDHAVAIVWCGRNDINTQDSGPHDDVVSHVLNGYDRLVQYQSATLPNFLVIGPMNHPNETAGSTEYEQVVRINTVLRDRYPGQYIDIRAWMINDALDELGYEPTPEDLEAIDGDAPPPSLTDGGSHYIKPVAPLLAQKFATALAERGYL